MEKSPRSFPQRAQGNTKLVPQKEENEDDKKRHRNYCMTIYNEEEMNRLKEEKTKYCIIGKEHCPTTGKLHYQCYATLTESQLWTTIKKKYPTAHIEIAKGTEAQNQKYCSKENRIFESGKIKHQGKKVTPDELRKMTNEEIIELDPRCHKAYIQGRDLLNNNMSVQDYRKKIEVIYIWGPSQSGKSNRALEIIEENGNLFNDIKYTDGFYSGIGDAPIALYDEWRDSHMKPSEFINMIDYNVHNMNIKGGNAKNKYKMIIITSVQDPDTIYAGMIDQEPKKQWESRMKVIKITPEV